MIFLKSFCKSVRHGNNSMLTEKVLEMSAIPKMPATIFKSNSRGKGDYAMMKKAEQCIIEEQPSFFDVCLILENCNNLYCPN
jgi:hypothetical protein